MIAATQIRSNDDLLPASSRTSPAGAGSSACCEQPGPGRQTGDTGDLLRHILAAAGSRKRPSSAAPDRQRSASPRAPPRAASAPAQPLHPPFGIGERAGRLGEVGGRAAPRRPAPAPAPLRAACTTTNGTASRRGQRLRRALSDRIVVEQEQGLAPRPSRAAVTGSPRRSCPSPLSAAGPMPCPARARPPRHPAGTPPASHPPCAPISAAPRLFAAAARASGLARRASA